MDLGLCLWTSTHAFLPPATPSMGSLLPHLTYCVSYHVGIAGGRTTRRGRSHRSGTLERERQRRAFPEEVTMPSNIPVFAVLEHYNGCRSTAAATPFSHAP